MKIIAPVVDLYRNIGVSGGTIPSLISTTVDNIYDDWDSGTSYLTGDRVVYGFLIYQADQDNSNQQPDVAGSVYWTALGYSNKYAMFNGATTSPTVQSGTDFVVEISAQDVNAISFFRVSGGSINIVMTHPTLGEVYNKTYDVRLNTMGIFDYYEYFFKTFPATTATTNLSVLDLPPYPTATIAITFSSPSDMSVGLMTYGTIEEIATVDWGTSISINDFSTKETNDFGDTTIVERPYTDQIEFNMTVERVKTSNLKSIFSTNRATPITVIGKDDEEGTHIYGFIDDFEITYSDFSTSDVTLTIEGL